MTRLVKFLLALTALLLTAVWLFGSHLVDRVWHRDMQLFAPTARFPQCATDAMQKMTTISLRGGSASDEAVAFDFPGSSLADGVGVLERMHPAFRVTIVLRRPFSAPDEVAASAVEREVSEAIGGGCK